MSLEFNFIGLSDIYSQALDRNEPTLAFQINNGNGHFVFMMFFDQEDDKSHDKLFLLCRNVNVILKLKMYGNHKKSDFIIYLNNYEMNTIIQELQLQESGNSFDFMNFMHSLNLQIPKDLPLESKISKLREVWTLIDLKDRKNLVEESKKIYLRGIVRLPEGSKPREKTLRKLYVYTNGRPEDISVFISTLKDHGITLAWTDKENLAKNFADIVIQV